MNERNCYMLLKHFMPQSMMLINFIKSTLFAILFTKLINSFLDAKFYTFICITTSLPTITFFESKIYEAYST